MFGSTLPPAAAAAVAEGASLTRKQQGASAGGACYEHRVPVGTPTSTALFGEKVARTRNGTTGVVIGVVIGSTAALGTRSTASIACVHPSGPRGRVSANAPPCLAMPVQREQTGSSDCRGRQAPRGAARAAHAGTTDRRLHQGLADSGAMNYYGSTVRHAVVRASGSQAGRPRVGSLQHNSGRAEV